VFIRQEPQVKTSLRVFIVVSACFAMLGCTTLQQLPAERTQLSQTLQPNDRVVIVTHAGQRLKFKVDSVDASGVHGAGQHVAYDDIQSISLTKNQTGRALLIAAGIAAVAAAAGGGGGGGGY
jgi:hypothetical protein